MNEKVKRFYDENGDEAGNRRVPVAVRRGFPNQDTVKDEVAKTELYSS